MYRLCRYCKAFFRYSGVKQRWGGKTTYLEAKCIDISKTVADTSKGTIND